MTTFRQLTLILFVLLLPLNGPIAQPPKSDKGTTLVALVAEALPPHKVHAEGKPKGVRCVIFSPDSKSIVSGGLDGRLFLSELSKAEESKKWDRKQQMSYSIAFSPNGKLLAVGDDMDVLIVDAITWQSITSFQPVSFVGLGGDATKVLEKCETYVSFSSDGARLVVRQQPVIGDVAHEGVITLFSTSSWKREKMISLDERDDLVVSPGVELLPDGKIAVGAGNDAVVIDPNTMKRDAAPRYSKIPIYMGKTKSVAFSSNKELIAFTPNKTDVEIWSVSRIEKLAILNNTSKATSIVFSPNDQYLAVGYDDGLIKTWRLTVTSKK